jgi:transposase
MRGDELPPELDTKEKIRTKIEEIEQIQGKRLKRAAKTIIEAHITGNENQKKEIEEKIEKAEEEIKKSGQKSVSITDPESRFMENKKKRNELSYNPQITVDHDSGIIVALANFPKLTKKQEAAKYIYRFTFVERLKIVVFF